MIKGPPGKERERRECHPIDKMFIDERGVRVKTPSEELYKMIQGVKRKEEPVALGDYGGGVEDRRQIHPCHEKHAVDVDHVFEENGNRRENERNPKRKKEKYYNPCRKKNNMITYPGSGNQENHKEGDKGKEQIDQGGDDDRKREHRLGNVYLF